MKTLPWLMPLLFTFAVADGNAAQPKGKKNKPHDAVEETSETPRAKPNPRPETEIAAIIDGQIEKKAAADGIECAPSCSDEEFLRRASLDIIGVIPTIEKTKAFLTSTDKDKRAKLIEELLADERYGRHLADYWEQRMFVRDPKNRFIPREPFVKWLEKKFNDNTSWDVLTREILTAKGSLDAHPETAFYLTSHSVDKITDSVTKNFLGIQLQCAQCHNHPFADWKQEDYWATAAFFSKLSIDRPKNPKKGFDNDALSVHEGQTRSRDKDFFPEGAKNVAPHFLDGKKASVKETNAFRPAFAEWATAPTNKYFAKSMVNRVWSKFFGAGLIEPIDDMTQEASHPELLDALTKEFTASGFDLKHLARCICLSKAYQRSAKPVTANDRQHDVEYFARMRLRVLTPEQLFDSFAEVTHLDPKDAPAASEDKKKKEAMKVPLNYAGPRDRFVLFFRGERENDNAAEYEEGIPQALKMMNGGILGFPKAMQFYETKGAKPDQVIESLYLAALCRKPTTTELDRLKSYVSKAKNPSEGYSNVLWALLNSSEFTMIR